MRVLPYKVYRRTIMVGLEDPHNRLVLSELETLTGRRIKPAVMLSSCLEMALRNIAASERLQALPQKRAPRVPVHIGEPSSPGNDAPRAPRDGASEAQHTRGQTRRLHRARQFLRDALVAYGSEDLTVALTALDQSLVLDPFDPRAHRHRAYILKELEDFPGAERAFINALALDSTDFGTWRELAAVCVQQGRVDAAVDAWIRAEEIAVTSEQTAEVRAQLMKIQQGQDHL